VQDYQYDSFGNLKDLKNRIKQPYTYTGREFDRETELYYYRARYYDAAAGRFVSKDPIGFEGGINDFAYANNNPIIFIDYFGFEGISVEEGMKIVNFARSWIGTPYKSAGIDSSGIDCSHFVSAVYRQAGFDYGYAQTNEFPPGDKFNPVSTPQEGDVVLFYHPIHQGHMGIYTNGQHISARSGKNTRRVDYGRLIDFGQIVGYYRFNRRCD